MPFADKMLSCAQCGTSFIFTVDEQRRMAEAGQEVVEPSLCPVCRMDQRRSGRHTGRVKWFDGRKGYGFILEDAGGEIFVHFSGILGQGFKRLEEGQLVEYDIEETPRGRQAVRVMSRSA